MAVKAPPPVLLSDWAGFYLGVGWVEEVGGAGFGADGVVALEVAHDGVVGVDVLAGDDGLKGESDDLIEFADGLSGADGADGELVAGGDSGERGEAESR